MLEMIDKTTVSQIYLDNVMSALAEMVIVLDEDGKIKVFKSVEEIEFYIEVYFYEGCDFFFPKVYVVKVVF